MLPAEYWFKVFSSRFHWLQEAGMVLQSKIFVLPRPTLPFEKLNPEFLGQIVFRRPFLVEATYGNG